MNRFPFSNRLERTPCRSAKPHSCKNLRVQPNQGEPSRDDIEVLGTERVERSENWSWLALLGFVVVGGIGVWAVVGSPSDEEVPSSTTASTVVESPFWSDSASGVRVVDLSTLIDDSVELASNQPTLVVTVDVASLPDEYGIVSEFSFADPRRLAEDPVTYNQEIQASKPDGTNLFVSLRGTEPSPDDPSRGEQLTLLTGWTPQVVRGVEGRVSGNAVAWIESGVGFVTIRSTSEPIDTVLEIVEGLVFAEDELDVFAFPGQAPAFESLGPIVFSGPNGRWVFDEAEVLIVNGRPGSTGRLPSTAVDGPIVLVVAQDDAAAVAGVAPAEVTSIRVLTSAGQTAEISTVESPANPANSLFAFGLDPRLDARSLELVDSGGRVVRVFDLPIVFLPSRGANFEID